MSQNGYGEFPMQSAASEPEISLCLAASPKTIHKLFKQLTCSWDAFVPSGAFKAILVSTVLAQDRFFSDFWSSTFDKQDPQSHHDDVVGCCSEDLLQLMLRI